MRTARTPVHERHIQTSAAGQDIVEIGGEEGQGELVEGLGLRPCQTFAGSQHETSIKAAETPTSNRRHRRIQSPRRVSKKGADRQGKTAIA